MSWTDGLPAEVQIQSDMTDSASVNVLGSSISTTQSEPEGRRDTGNPTRLVEDGDEYDELMKDVEVYRPW
jgi:hypothetical protein